MTKGQILYRARADFGYISYDEWIVVRPTPQGAWITPHDPNYSILNGIPKNQQKGIGDTSKFAWATKDEADESLRRRCEHWVYRAQGSLERAKDALAVANGGKPAPKSSAWDIFDGLR